MKCEICEISTEDRYCDECGRIMNHVIREIGPDIWENIDDCKFIYPMVRRVVEGTLTTQDIVNELLKGEI